MGSGSNSAAKIASRVDLETGDLLLIAAGEGHEIRTAEGAALVTVSVYAPPAY